MIGLNPIEWILVWLLLIYTLFTTGVYLALNLLALDTLIKYMSSRRSEEEDQLLTGYEPPISLIIPAYNEAGTIVSSVRSLMQLYYSEFELIVVNDGSSDTTLDVLKREFDLVPYVSTREPALTTQPVHEYYLSRNVDNLRVIDKTNGGKADSLNAGLNISRCPLYCSVDADSVLERYSLLKAVQPFIEDPSTVACGGTVRIANGCKVKGGHVIETGLPRHPLALFQILEYLRSFLFGRIGWARLNSLLIISGAFGVLHKDTVIRAGGYRTDTVGEDMELIVRLHRYLAGNRENYRIAFIPDPICWTEVPENLRTFGLQRSRWQRGLSESLWLNRELCFRRGSGLAGWLAYPFFVLVEWLSPFVELGGYLFTAWLYFTGKVSPEVAVLILIFAVLLSMLLSTVALLLDEITFHGLSRLNHILVLFLVAFLECFGYRQINTWYRLKGSILWLLKRRADWGRMTRSGRWQQTG